MTPEDRELRERLGLSVPVVAAPMAGGPSTPELVVAVGEAGGLGFLAAGYRTADEVRRQIDEVRGRTTRPFGVNVFVPGEPAVDRQALENYRLRLTPLANRMGIALGEPRWDDDDYGATLDVIESERVPVVSFTFGCPTPDDVARLHTAGSLVVVTVTNAAEAVNAEAAGADALCVQGCEAGAHRGSFADDPALAPGAGALPLLSAVADVRAAASLPLIAAGGLMGGADIRSVLDAGAAAAQLGTAFLRCPEAGTTATHRRALVSSGFSTTAFTRAFTGRTARGLVNAFMRDNPDPPAGYPWVHHLTRPLRVAAAERGDADVLHLWAGENWRRIRDLPAGDLVARLADEVARPAHHHESC
jgi:nitronate monooxygenase